MNYFLVVLFSAAITVVFTQGKPTAFVREHGPALWRELMSCPLCSGVWIGAGSLLLVGGQLPGLLRVYEALALGCATGCLAWLFVALLNVTGSLEVWLDGHEARAKTMGEAVKQQVPLLVQALGKAIGADLTPPGAPTSDEKLQS